MPVNSHRLERLATLLDNYQPGPDVPAFDLEQWGRTGTKRTGFLKLREVQCHTAACAVGLACLSGEFRDEGLRFEIGGPMIYPHFAGVQDWRAVQKFFGLSEKQALRLFQDTSYAGPTTGVAAAQAVAARIRQTIAASKAAQQRKANARTRPAVQAIKELVGAH